MELKLIRESPTVVDTAVSGDGGVGAGGLRRRRDQHTAQGLHEPHSLKLNNLAHELAS